MCRGGIAGADVSFAGDGGEGQTAHGFRVGTRPAQRPADQGSFGLAGSVPRYVGETSRTTEPSVCSYVFTGRGVTVDALLQDLRYAYRQARKNPGVTLAVILVL